jgi:cytochrome c-type biogenesis protein CcmH/NrfG
MAANPLSAEYAVTALNAHVNLVPATGLAAAGTRSPAFDDALAAADRAIALEPGNPYRTAGLVGLLVIGGEDVDPTYTQSAVETARTAVERWPNHLELSYWYAKALVDAGEMDKAVMQLRRVLDIRPGYGQAALLMSDLLAGGGDADGARAVLEASLKQAKNAQVKARLESLGGSTP